MMVNVDFHGFILDGHFVQSPTIFATTYKSTVMATNIKLFVYFV